MTTRNKYTSESTKFVRSFCDYVNLCGVGDFWMEKPKWRPLIELIHRYVIYIFSTGLIALTIFFEISALFKDMSDDLKNDNVMFTNAHCIFAISYINLRYYCERIKLVIKTLVVTFKEIYNDEVVEKEMLIKAKMQLCLLIIMCFMAIFTFTLTGILRSIRTGAPFITLITFWPDIVDTSTAAKFSRIIFNIALWMIMLRVIAMHYLVILMTIYTAYQFRQLESYFTGLERIFLNNDSSQQQKEQNYIKAFIKGLTLHEKTLWCVREIQINFGTIYWVQMIMNLVTLFLTFINISQSTERNFNSILSTISIGGAVLISTGLFMCNAGEITIEAGQVPYAMFSSGWHHCKGAAASRITPLLVVGICRSQVPVVVTALKIMTLSYQNYVSVIRASYSAFTVLY